VGKKTANGLKTDPIPPPVSEKTDPPKKTPAETKTAPKDVAGPILAEMGDFQVTYAHVAELAAKRQGYKIVEELLNRQIVEEEIRRHRIQVPEKDLQERYEAHLKDLEAEIRQRSGEAVTVKQYLEACGCTVNEYRERSWPLIQRRLAVEYLVRFQFLIHDTYDVSVIYLKEKNAAVQVKNKLDKGARFATLAEETSLHPSKRDGGFLGFFIRGDFLPGNPKFETVIYNLAPHVHSDVVEFSDGFYIFRLNEIKKGKPNLKFAETLEALRKFIREKPVSQEEILKWLNRLRGERKIAYRQEELRKFDNPNQPVMPEF
jgi:parvulin-like peptidyl-prolyl isomerase